MNYIIKDEQKFARIYLDNFSEQLTPVSDSFKIIVLVDKKFVDKIDMAFLNRFEKMHINFRDLLEDAQKQLTKNIKEEIRLKEEIKKARNEFNYDLNYLLINCKEQDISGLVYYSFLLIIEISLKNSDLIILFIFPSIGLIILFSSSSFILFFLIKEIIIKKRILFLMFTKIFEFDSSFL
jgi:hypothetical protein